MDEIILQFLKSYKYKTIAIGELEHLFSGDIRYEDFAGRIMDIAAKGILLPVKAQGENQKPISLANVYRINKAVLHQDLRTEIEGYQFLLHPQIILNEYFTLPEELWQSELPYIKKIDAYLQEKGLPVEAAAAPERSYHLVGDEKWIDEKGGKRILERLGLWEAMRIVGVPDPLMLAINPAAFDQDPCRHLIVENKTAFNALLEILPESSFASLIYGAGWKVVGNISMLEKQLNLNNREHQLLYFGDMDYEGITIWYSLNQKRAVRPALEFYRELLGRSFTKGKEKQQKNKKAMESFLVYFSDTEQGKISDTLNNGGYYPQELLDKAELQDVWRRVTCT